MRRHTWHRAAKGFTIIEIMVVIAVIGILSGLIITGYNGAQDRARVSTMKSDLSGSVDLLELYAARNGNEYPGEGEGIESLQNGAGLPESSGNKLSYYTNSGDVDAEGKALQYCIQISNEKVGTYYHATSTSNGIKEGECTDFLASINYPSPPPLPEDPPLPTTPPPCGPPNVGDSGPGGGRIIYRAPTQQSWGCHIEAALSVEAPTSSGQGWWSGSGSEPQFKWGCRGTEIPGARLTGVGRGKSNTQAIINTCTSEYTAAHKARSFRGGGLNDWYLPNREEMQHLINYNNGNPPQLTNGNPTLNRLNLKQGSGWIVGGYWTSMDNGANAAWAFSTYGRAYGCWGACWVSSGGWVNTNKNCSCADAQRFVRPVRAF